MGCARPTDRHTHASVCLHPSSAFVLLLFSRTPSSPHCLLALQEMPERAPLGQMPRAVSLVLEYDLVDKVNLSIYQSINQSINQSIIARVCLSVRLSGYIDQSLHVSACLSVRGGGSHGCLRSPHPPFHHPSHGSTTRQVKPGDRVQVMGVYKALAGQHNGSTSGAYARNAPQHAVHPPITPPLGPG